MESYDAYEPHTLRRCFSQEDGPYRMLRLPVDGLDGNESDDEVLRVEISEYGDNQNFLFILVLKLSTLIYSSLKQYFLIWSSCDYLGLTLVFVLF